MARQLPHVDIAGTPFFVDVLHEELQQQDNRRNTISFDVFQQDGDGYSFLYDKESKKAVEEESIEAVEHGRYEWVTLPALMELDPVGIALKYDIPIEVLCPEMAGMKIQDNEEEDEFF